MSVFLRSRFAVWRVAFALTGGSIVSYGLLTGFSPSLAKPRGPGTSPLEIVTGTARVVDGDTIDIDGKRIRLEGIDAPEAAQTCTGRYAGGIFGEWRCGVAASAALVRLTRSKTVTCEARETDKYNRLIATCFVNGRNINRAMVRRGHAWAFVKYSDTYTDEERQARLEKTGLWASSKPATPAWEYRSRRWTNAAQAAPEGCVIKGNISAGGDRIYHTPWSPWYGKVRIKTDAGEQWFCDEAEALAAGFRPAKVR